ncbi:MAG: IreB family regulatory phosphoprotein [Erysipelotrichaceae bacterium]
MNKNTTETMAFSKDEIRKENIKDIFTLVNEALNERGYNAVSQISGYLISNDPAYISSHMGARLKIQEVDRYEIIDELVSFYLEHNK